MFNERRIRIFLHVCLTKSFTQSAQQLFLSQQAVSKSIADLEEDVGKVLFERKYRKLELTNDGRKMRQIFSDFLRAYDNFVKPEIARDRQVILRVGYLQFCDYGTEMTQVFADIQAAHHGVVFYPETLTPEELLAKIGSGSLDVGFTRDVLLPPDYPYFVQPIAENQMYLAISVLADNSGGENEMFLKQPLIVNAIENETLEETMERGHNEIRRLGLQTDQVVIAPNRESAMHYAEMGVGVLPTSDSSWIRRSNALQFMPIPLYDTTVCVWQDSEFTPLFEQCCRKLRKAFHYQKRDDWTYRV